MLCKTLHQFLQIFTLWCSLSSEVDCSDFFIFIDYHPDFINRNNKQQSSSLKLLCEILQHHWLFLLFPTLFRLLCFCTHLNNVVHSLWFDPCLTAHFCFCCISILSSLFVASLSTLHLSCFHMMKWFCSLLALLISLFGCNTPILTFEYLGSVEWICNTDIATLKLIISTFVHAYKFLQTPSILS